MEANMKKHIEYLLSQIPRNEINIFNKDNFLKLLSHKIEQYKIQIPINYQTNNDNPIISLLNHSLLTFLIKTISNLIQISRTRNINFNLLSRNSQIPFYTIHTYNWKKLPSNNNSNNNINNNNASFTFFPNKSFNLLFTENIRSKIDLIQEYEELNSKKIKLERLNIYKNKIEEMAKEKGAEPNIKITTGPNPIRLAPGRRTRRKESQIIKTMRNNISKTQKKEDLDRQKNYTIDTLETVLNGTKSTKVSEVSKSVAGFDNMSKISDNKSEMNTTVHGGDIGGVNNELSLNVFKYNEIGKDEKLYNASKRKINLKDFVFMLEHDDGVIPLKMLLLQKAMLRISQLHNTKNQI